jgi:ATP phosphoribosyltransferase
LIDGVVDIAIVGDNLLVEKGKEIQVIQKLVFKMCFSCCSKNIRIQFNQRLRWLRIATYPNTVNEYFNSFGVKVDIHQISGSVEIAPNIGLADAIVDIVSSGSTLFKK